MNLKNIFGKKPIFIIYLSLFWPDFNKMLKEF